MSHAHPVACQTPRLGPTPNAERGSRGQATQCDLKATTKRVDSQPIATPKPPQCDPNATPKLLQGSPKASASSVRLKDAQPGRRLRFTPYQPADIYTGDGYCLATDGYRYAAVAPPILGGIPPSPSREFCPAASLSSDMFTRMLAAFQPNATRNPRTFRWTPNLMQRDGTDYLAY
jgi:hypothetical protein